MKTGGYRPGAGRPPSKPKKSRKLSKELPKDIVADARAAKMKPLEYMLAVMNDPVADETRRDRMAIAAAPFCHPRVSDLRIGKKDQLGLDAVASVEGSEWGELLGWRTVAN